MFLSTFQRAVLQEMDIPVWIEQASQHDIVNAHNANSPDIKRTGVPEKTHQAPHLSSEDKQARLAQLRAQVSSTSNAEPSRASGASSTIKSQPDVTHKAAEPLTQIQHKQALLWLNDVNIALSQLGLSLTSEQVKIGETLQINEREIILPVAPHLLSGAQQKLLWQALCTMTTKTA